MCIRDSLLAINSYFESKGELSRKKCLIPKSAHGTNPASAVMAGFDVLTVECDDEGNIDFQDLSIKVKKFDNQIGALMLTYPSTLMEFLNCKSERYVT